MFIHAGVKVPADYKGPMTYEALTKAGVPLFAYGNFITILLNFLILAFIIFQMVRYCSTMKEKAPPEAEGPAAPAPALGRPDAADRRPSCCWPRSATALTKRA